MKLFAILMPLLLSDAFQSEVPVFRDIAQAAGLDIVVVSGGPDKDFLIESIGGGLGVIDYDNDGWMDLYVVNGGTFEELRTGKRTHHNALYRNNGDSSFRDVTRQAGVPGIHWGKGVLVADLDGDGFDDLYVTNLGPNTLYHNNHDGTFTDITDKAGVGEPRFSSAAAAADFDLDGDLDIFVANYLDYDLDHLPVAGKFCSYMGIAVACGPRGLKGVGDTLYRNNGDGTFTDVSESAGVSDAAGYYGLGAVWGDYDLDGDPDLFVANDATPNFLYRNEGNGTFQETGMLSGVAYSEDGREQSGMGVDMEDFDNDGWPDVLVTNFSHDYNTLYQNQRNGTFSDVSINTGLAADSQPDLSWGAGFWDFNNDGLKDLFISNGHIHPQVDGQGLNVSYRQANKLYLNDGAGRFVNVSNRAGAAMMAAKSSRGAAFADFNNDGAVDVALTELDDRPTLLINQLSGGNHWILVQLEGSAGNRHGVGARISVRTGKSTQVREIKAGSSYASTNDYRAHFGLGKEEVVQELQVRWPSGKISTLRNVPVDRSLRITEGETTDVKP